MTTHIHITKAGRAEIVRAAKEAARIHQQEFPGEPVSGDWDSEAFVIDKPASWQWVAWEIYREALHAQVNRLRMERR